MEEHRKESLMARDLTPSKGVDYILGMYIIGDTVKNNQIESGVFLKGKSPEDLHLYHTIATIPVAGAIERISNLYDLQSRLNGSSMAMYDGENILLKDTNSNLAARYEPIPNDARKHVLSEIQQDILAKIPIE